ncbi:MAG TPA: branched-chain amino acid ABC transporter ATP-binding protein/permease [Castellaniella sp.]|uniref:branched-chain amino acid ABC transporter ATP-binding protein/permease n=1 Tax=Castellaniella sp. TaxID=1955812 RepID=UPI002F1D9DC8
MKGKLLQPTALALLVLAGLLVALNGSGYYAQTLFTIALFILLSLGWNIISGFAGYVSFGQVSFFGFGAYVAALAMIHLEAEWYIAAILAAIVTAALALLLGWIMLRLHGIFFALGMFGLARILQIIASSLSITGGPMGTTVLPAESPNESALVMVLVAACGILITYILSRSRLGLRLMATRDDDLAAQSSGIHTFRAKLQALCLSAAFGGIGGALYVWNIGYLDPSSAFNGSIELQTVLMVLAGGIGTVWGPVIGGILISLIGTFLWARFPTEQQVILGALTIFIAVVMPGGITAFFQKLGWWQRVPIWSPPPTTRTGQLDDATPPTGTPQHTAVLSCRDLGIRFGGVKAVDGVSLQAHPGEMLAIIGPNGAGKSTLFSLMSNYLSGTGTTQYRGQDTRGMKPYALAQRGLARTFQSSRLFASLTVWETVLAAASSGKISHKAATQNAARVLRETGLIEHWDALPDTLPPGLQRLLEIARALALKPKVLLLDEAMAGMTIQEINHVHTALRRAMNDGCAVVAIEHVLPAIVDLAARAQVLDFGKTIAQGTPHEVLRDPRVIDAYMGADYES